MAKKIKYDNIIIGSSPASMVEAICLTYRGKKVLVLEKNDRIGGAWSTIDFPEGENFEANCHILLGSRKAYSVMNFFLGWSMHIIKPQPMIWINGYFFHYNSPLRFIIRFFQNLIKKIRKVSHDGDKSLKINISGRSLNFSRINILKNTLEEILYGHIYYPKGGTPEMMEELLNKFNKKGGCLKFDEDVKSVEISKTNSSALIKTNKNTYYSKEVVITNGSDLDEIIIDNKREIIASREQNSIQIYMFLKDNSDLLISYVLLFGHDIIHRVSEMNKSHLKDKNLNSNYRLLVIQLRNSFVENTPDSLIGNLVLKALLETSFVSSKAELKSYHLVNYPANYKKEGILDAISYNSNGKIRILPVDDLSKTILQRYQENFSK